MNTIIGRFRFFITGMSKDATQCSPRGLPRLSVAVSLTHLFEIADLQAALFQNGKDVFQRNVLLRHQHQKMIQKIADLVFGVGVLSVFGGDDHLGTFLAAFFQDLVQPLLE